MTGDENANHPPMERNYIATVKIPIHQDRDIIERAHDAVNARTGPGDESPRTDQRKLLTMSNYCSNCGHRTYQHARGKCQHIETVGHVVKIVANASATGGWMMRHPVAERNDDLFDCPMVKSFLDVVAGWPEPGEYALSSSNGGISFWPPEVARQQCDCGNIDSAVDIARAAMDDGNAKLSRRALLH